MPDSRQCDVPLHNRCDTRPNANIGHPKLFMGCEPAAGGTGAADREELRREPLGERESDWLLTSIFVYRFFRVPAPAGQLC